MKRKIRSVSVILCLSLMFFGIGCELMGKTYYVATTGKDNNPGTIEQPWGTWQKAFETAISGDTVYFMDGIWRPSSSQAPPFRNAVTAIGPKFSPSIGHDGTYENPICFFNYPGANPILDCSDITPIDNYIVGIALTQADHIKFRGLTVRNIYQGRDYVECFGIAATNCSNLTFENMTVHDVAGNAFRYAGALGGYGIEYDSTYFINCDAYNCADSRPRTPGAKLGGAADGFKTWNEPGSYFLFEGCRAWNCSDDGFDPGTDAVTVINNCWSFKNGYLDGDGAGFKTGGMIHDNGDKITRIVTNNIAALNSGYGFFLLEYPPYYRTNARFYNNTSYGNQFGFAFSINQDSPVLGVWINNLAFQNNELEFTNAYTPYSESNNSWDLVDGYPGYVMSDSVMFADTSFYKLDVNELSYPRQSNGSLPIVSFGHAKANSKLKLAGKYVGMSIKPDIGVDWNYLENK